jgi:hypothetical protein
VLVLNEQNQVEYRGVEVGQVHDGLREVKRYREIAEPGKSGADSMTRVEVLKPTDRVIVQGLQRVRAGVTVTPQQVDMLTLLVKQAAGPTNDIQTTPAAKPASEEKPANAAQPASKTAASDEKSADSTTEANQ